MNDLSTPLHQAVKVGDINTIESLLKEEGTDVNAQDEYGDTVLHLAAWQGDKNTAYALKRPNDWCECKK